MEYFAIVMLTAALLTTFGALQRARLDIRILKDVLEDEASTRIPQAIRRD